MRYLYFQIITFFLIFFLNNAYGKEIIKKLEITNHLGIPLLSFTDDNNITQDFISSNESFNMSDIHIQSVISKKHPYSYCFKINNRTPRNFKNFPIYLNFYENNIKIDKFFINIEILQSFHTSHFCTIASKKEIIKHIKNKNFNKHHFDFENTKIISGNNFDISFVFISGNKQISPNFNEIYSFVQLINQSSFTKIDKEIFTKTLNEVSYILNYDIENFKKILISYLNKEKLQNKYNSLYFENRENTPENLKKASSNLSLILKELDVHLKNSRDHELLASEIINKIKNLRNYLTKDFPKKIEFFKYVNDNPKYSEFPTGFKTYCLSNNCHGPSISFSSFLFNPDPSKINYRFHQNITHEITHILGYDEGIAYPIGYAMSEIINNYYTGSIFNNIEPVYEDFKNNNENIFIDIRDITVPEEIDIPQKTTEKDQTTESSQTNSATKFDKKNYFPIFGNSIIFLYLYKYYLNY
ncbi:hypothetical protein [Pigmentibacter ruber]|uniref:hypothetical protein n=1 Tax=Pigmentibacter ruber TaxID=2683196 RepID=UPI00131CE700|nr:hypothetical protein [Pigmentibacter ruber]